MQTVPVEAPPSPSADVLKRIGDFKRGESVVHLLERDGRLHVLGPNVDAPLDATEDPDVFRVGTDTLTIQRDAGGVMTGIDWRGAVIPIVEVPSDDGGQLQLSPVRPVSELRPEALAAQPPEQAGDLREPDLVPAVSVDSTIQLDVRYATTNNFLGTPFYRIAGAWLQRPVAEALARASARLRESGYGVVVFDGYRPWFVTKIFWEATPEPLRWLVADPAQGNRHNRGCAVDLSLYDLKTGQPVVMPGTYDEATLRSRADYPGGTTRQRWLRAVLREAMEAEGFTGLDYEWWHFDHADWQSYPILNVPFDQLSGS